MGVLLGSFTFGVLINLGFHRCLPRVLAGVSVIRIVSRVREKAHPLIVIYLLAHIGLVGGAEAANQGFASVVVPGILSIALAVALFVIALFGLARLRIADRGTRISLATHFGSVSVGTFAAAQIYLIQHNTPFDASAAIWLVLMEIPAVLLGTIVLGGGVSAFRQAIRNRELLVLVAAVAVGYIGGTRLVDMLSWAIVTPFLAILAYFLFDMGLHASNYIMELRGESARLIIFGIGMPLCGGVLGGIVGTVAGMNVGDAALLSTLSASASYVAATATMSRLVPPKVIATSLMVSLGITLPWNMLVGIPLYASMALAMHYIARLPIAEAMLRWILF